MKEINFAFRLKEARKNAGLTQQELANIVGRTKSAVSRWESGENTPQLFDLAKIEHAVGVSGKILMYGTEEIEPNTLSRITATSSKLRELRQERVLDFATDQLIEQNHEHEVHESPAIYLTITAHSFQSAGDGYFQDSDVAVDVQVPQDQIPDDYDDASIVIGDSMKPRLEDGDLLFIKYTPQVEIGQIGIFRTDKGNFVKRLQANCLESLNPAYDNIYFNDGEEADAIGVVIDYYRK